MPSLIELIFSTSGTSEASAATAKVTAELNRLEQAAKTAFGSGSTSDIVASQNALNEYRTHAQRVTSQHVTLTQRVEETSAVFRDSLLPHLDRGTQQLLEMAAAAFTLHEAYAGFKNALGDGAELEHLSMRTGESVRNLVIEEQAFKNSGLGAQFLGTAINLVDRSLSSTSANAKRNQLIYRELGLSMQEMRTADFAEKLQLLSDAFAKLPNQADRAAIAMQLFGRYSGGQMLQLLGDPEALSLATEQAGRLGDRMAQDANAFLEVEKHLSVVTLRLKEMFVAGAEEVLPTLESIASVLGGMNLSGLGSVMGAAGPTALGGVAAIWGIDKLDLALLNVAEKYDGYMTGSLASVAAKATGILATALPIGLGLAVTGQLIAGIAEARASAEWQQVVADINAARGLRGETDRKLRGITSSADAGDTVASLTSRLSSLQSQKTALEKELALAGPGPKSVEDVANQGTTSGTIAAYAAKLIGGSNYVGSDGKKRDFTSDQSELLKLNQEIVTLRSAIEKLSSPAGIENTIAANQLADLKASLAPLQLDQLRKKHSELALKTESPLNRLIDLGNTRRAREAELAQPEPDGLSEEDSEKHRLKLQNEIAELKEKEAAAGAKVAEDLKKSADEPHRRLIFELETKQEVAAAAGNDEEAAKLKKEISLKRAVFELNGVDLQQMNARIEAEDKITQAQIARKHATEAIEAERVALEKSLNAARETLAKLEADFSVASADKWQKRKEELEKEVGILKAQIDADEAAAADARAGGNKQLAQQYDQSAASKGRQLAGTQGQIAQIGPNPNSISDQLVAQSTSLQNSMGTVAQQIGQAWQSLGSTMRNSLGDAFYGMLSRAQSFRQAVGSMWVSLASDVGHSASKMAADYVMQHFVMDNARKLFHALGLIEQKAATSGELGVHATGEAAKTGATAAGAGARTGIRITETVMHGIQVTIRTAMHLAGEVLQTTITLAQSALRIAAYIGESLVSIIKAATGAMSAMANIPYVGPILAVAAAAAMIAEGTSLIKGARETGGPVEAGSAYLVGEKRPEIFVPESDGYIFPDAGAFTAGGGIGRATAHATPVTRGASGGGSDGMRAQNIHVYLDKTAYSRAIMSDMYGIAHEVFDQRTRGA